MGGVDDDHVDLGGDEGGGALERVGADTDGGADPQPPALVLRGERVALALLDVLDRDQAAQAPVVVDDRQLLDLVAAEQQLGFGERRADRCGDQVLARHQLARALLGPRAEPEIAVREDADEHAVGARDRDARDAVAGHQVERVGDEVVGPSVTGSTIIPASLRFTLSISAT